MDEQVKARLIGATVLVVIAVALVPELLSGPKHAATTGSPVETRRGTRTVTIDLGGAVAGAPKAPVTPTPTEPATRGTVPLPEVKVPGAAAETGAAIEQSAESAGPAADVPVEPLPASPATLTKPASTTGASEPVPAATSNKPSSAVVSTPAPPVAVKPAGSPVAPATAAAKPAAEASHPPSSSATAGQGGWSVQVGAFGSADAARKLVGDLKGKGFTAYVAPLNRDGKTLHRVRVGPAPSKAEAEKLATGLKAKGLSGSIVPAQ